jgi:hypothetical protein
MFYRKDAVVSTLVKHVYKTRPVDFTEAWHPIPPPPSVPGVAAQYCLAKEPVPLPSLGEHRFAAPSGALDASSRVHQVGALRLGRENCFPRDGLRASLDRSLSLSLLDRVGQR